MLGDPSQFPHRRVHVKAGPRFRHPQQALRVGGDMVNEPAMVRSRPGGTELGGVRGVDDAAERRWCKLVPDQENLGGNALPVHLLQPSLRIEGPQLSAGGDDAFRIHDRHGLRHRVRVHRPGQEGVEYAPVVVGFVLVALQVVFVLAFEVRTGRLGCRTGMAVT